MVPNLATACAVVLVGVHEIASCAEQQIFESPETRVSLLELFTSEGCSSCPPAEAWVNKHRDYAGLWKSFVPVVFHVDYWDNLGWPDRFASPRYTDRQHRYASTWRSNSVYTPGFVLNGAEWRQWYRNGSMPATGPAAGKLKIAVHNDNRAEVTFSAATTAPLPKRARAEIVLLGGTLETSVKRGENSGRILRHDFVVLHLDSAQLNVTGSSASASFTLVTQLSATPSAIAAWVVNEDSLVPIQATGGWLRKP